MLENAYRIFRNSYARCASTMTLASLRRLHDQEHTTTRKTEDHRERMKEKKPLEEVKGL
jgi:hypothetical protein